MLAFEAVECWVKCSDADRFCSTAAFRDSSLDFQAVSFVIPDSEEDELLPRGCFSQEFFSMVVSSTYAGISSKLLFGVHLRA